MKRLVDPRQRALGLLARREHGSKELLRKLVHKGVATDEARSTVAQLAADGLQSDERRAQSLIRTRMSAGYGPVRVRAELAALGLKEAVGPWPEMAEWAQAAVSWLRKRGLEGSLNSPATRAEIAQKLQRRGFSPSLIAKLAEYDQ